MLFNNRWIKLSPCTKNQLIMYQWTDLICLLTPCRSQSWSASTMMLLDWKLKAFVDMHAHALAHKPKRVAQKPTFIKPTHTHTYLCLIKINTRWGLKPWNHFQKRFVPHQWNVEFISVGDCVAEEWGCLALNKQDYIWIHCCVPLPSSNKEWYWNPSVICWA